MTRFFSAALTTTCHDAYAAIGTANSTADKARQELNDRQAQLQSSEDERTKLTQAEGDDHVKRLLDGEDSCPRKPKRVTRIANLGEDIAALKQVIPQLRERVSQAEQMVERAKESFADQVVPVTHAHREQVADATREKLSELVPLLADLLACDLVQERLVGKKFVFTNNIQIFSGRHLVTRLLECLPDKLRPTSMNEDAVLSAAEANAEALINSIKGTGDA